MPTCVTVYGLEVFSLTKADQRSLDFVVIRFLMKLLCTSNMVTINACLSYFDFTLPSELLLKRYEKILTEKGIAINVIIDANHCQYCFV